MVELQNINELEQLEAYKRKGYDTCFCVTIWKEEIKTWFNLDEFFVYGYGKDKVDEMLETIFKKTQNLQTFIDITLYIRFQSRYNKEKVYTVMNTFSTPQISLIMNDELKKATIREYFNRMMCTLMGELMS